MPSLTVVKLEWLLSSTHLPPIVKATLQATALSALSNVLAQILKAYRTGNHFHLDLAPIFQFALYTFLNTPPNVLWQQFLESQFPGYTLQSRVEKVSDKPTPEETKWEEELAEEKAAQDEKSRTRGGDKRTASTSVDPAAYHHKGEDEKRQGEEHKE
ncbi:MAG: hypothetical protein M1831_005449 [Alyxoria varia]|nr:MAG: hypothetical protein M1831_005449 [Alyxoria varia]